MFCWSPSGSLGFWGHKPPVLLAWPCNKHFSAPNSNMSVCLASLCIGHMNLRSITKKLQGKTICSMLPWGHDDCCFLLSNSLSLSLCLSSLSSFCLSNQSRFSQGSIYSLNETKALLQSTFKLFWLHCSGLEVIISGKNVPHLWKSLFLKSYCVTPSSVCPSMNASANLLHEILSLLTYTPPF